MECLWHYARDGKRFGPVPEAELVELVSSGQLLLTDLAWTKGMANWLPIGKVDLKMPKNPVSKAPHPTKSFKEKLPIARPVSAKDQESEEEREDESPINAHEVDITCSIKYITEDKKWFKKTLIGGLLISFPIIEAICDGYQIQTIKNIRAGKRLPLPEWKNLGAFFMEGIKLRLVIYAMYIPAIALEVLTVIVDLISLGSTLFSDGKDNQRKVDTGRTVFKYILCPLLTIFVILLQAALFLLVPALARRAAHGASFLNLFNPIPSIRLMFGNFNLYVKARLTVFLLLLVFSIIPAVVSGVGLVIIIGPIIGWLILGLGRFWGRQTWAYYLAHMKNE